MGVVLAQNPQNLLSRAWSGVVVNVERLRDLGQKRDVNPAGVASEDEPNSSRLLFHKLNRTYYDAEVQNILEPAVGVTGVAFLKYDEALNRTFVFARIENLPVLLDKVVQLWLVKNINEAYQKVGIAEFFQDVKGGGPVAYSVFTHEGDLRTYQELWVAYDTGVDVPGPESVVIRLKF